MKPTDHLIIHKLNHLVQPKCWVSGGGDTDGLLKGGLYCVSNEVFYKRCAYEKQKKKTKDNDQNKSQINQILSL